MQPSIREAALLLSCLPKRYASRVLSRLRGGQTRVLQQQLNRLSESTVNERVQVVHQFLREVSSNSKGAARLRFDTADSSLPPFHFLSRLEPSEIARILSPELPQIQAVVLSQLAAAIRGRNLGTVCRCPTPGSRTATGRAGRTGDIGFARIGAGPGTDRCAPAYDGGTGRGRPATAGPHVGPVARGFPSVVGSNDPALRTRGGRRGIDGRQVR